MQNYVKPLLFTSALAMVAGGVVGPAHSKVQILFNEFAPPRFITNTHMINPQLKKIEKATNGRVTFKIPAKNLAPPPRQYDATVSGVMDGAYIFNAFLAKKMPHLIVSMLPLISDGGESRAVALWRTYKKYFEKENIYKGVKLISYMSTPGGHMFSMKGPITSVAAAKKLKFWSLPAMVARNMKSMGLTVVPGPAVRAYPIVSRGTVDAMVGMDFYANVGFKLNQFIKSGTLIPGGIFGGTFSMFINKKKWDTISKGDQKIFMAHMGERFAHRSKIWDDADAKARAEFSKTKKIYTPNAKFMAAMKKAWLPTHAAWVKLANSKGLKGQKILDYYITQARAVQAKSMMKK
jgi:TRAP-type C4-dicarboxylate transport system substrate-binding protein